MKPLFIICMLFILNEASSQEIKQIDLEHAAQVNTLSIKPGDYIFKFINVPPGSTYDEFQIEVVDQVIPVLPTFSFGPGTRSWHVLSLC